jgi:transcriptional regulator with XRE-family HTH domain
VEIIMTGHELKVERVTLRLKQIDLAARTGIPRERLSRFENGWQSLRPDELRRIREVLDRLHATRPREAGTTGAADPAQTVYATEDHR